MINKNILTMLQCSNDEFIIKTFLETLEKNRIKAQQKKEEYLQRIMQIFRQFVNKSELQIDRIIKKKLYKLETNYKELIKYLQEDDEIETEEKKLIVTEFLVKPFQKFPFSGNKNEKLFKQQYNLIEKASLLIEQTLVDSFNEEEIPNFYNHKFFTTIQNHGLGEQSLIRLNVAPQNISLEAREDLIPIQKNIHSLKMIGQYLILIGDERYLQIWDLEYRICIKKLYLDVIASISSLCILNINDLVCLAIGFGDVNPEIWIYRTDNWKLYGSNLSHTRAVTKLIQTNFLLLSGSNDGNVSIHSLQPFKHLHSCPHISSVQDLFLKNNYVYVLLKCSSLCEYELIQHQTQAILQFRRTLSTGFISMIRYTEVGNNFTGVACHIYGLSQIQITRKFKVEETNIINVSEMIADFIVIESKQTSDYYAVCGFQNSSAVRIYSLRTGEAIYEISSDYLGEVGVAGYLPKVQIAFVDGQYWIMLINQSQFQSGNFLRIYRLRI